MRGNGKLVLGRNGLGRVKLGSRERLHIYIIGASRTGKSSLLYNLIHQDIEAGRAVGLIDVHGDLAREVEEAIYHLIPNEREKRRRVVLLDPTRGAFGFNPLEIPEGEDPYPYILELQSLFKKLWEEAWGERMGEILRNSCLVLAEKGLTLCEMPKLLTDPAFRASLLEGLKNKGAWEYFTERFARLPKREQATWIESTLNKVNQFISDPLIRDVVGQQHSTINFREIIDTPGSVLLICLPKGKLKENSFLLGALLINKIQEAVLSRTDIPKEKRQRFFLYIDEFQNFGIKSQNFQECLSEAGKYGLSLTLAHQNTDQIDQELLSSVLGNTDCQIAFRIQRRDAELIGKEIFKVDVEELAWERAQGLRPMSLPESWEEHYNSLSSLKRRQAYVVIKGRGRGRSYRLKTLSKREYRVREEQLRAQAEMIMASYCRSREEIRREQEERERELQEEAERFEDPREF